MPIKINIKDKVIDNICDLSLSELEEIPIKEIATLKRVTVLDLSLNRLDSLGKNFCILNRMVKLDLSKNCIRYLPDEFGLLKQLRYLDLFGNQLEYLPLSFGNLHNLRYLNLHNNPLNAALAKITGPCLTNRDCQESAKRTVNFMSLMQLEVQKQYMQAMLMQNQAKSVNTHDEKPCSSYNAAFFNAINLNSNVLLSMPVSNADQNKTANKKLNKKLKTNKKSNGDNHRTSLTASTKTAAARSTITNNGLIKMHKTKYLSANGHNQKTHKPLTNNNNNNSKKHNNNSNNKHHNNNKYKNKCTSANNHSAALSSLITFILLLIVNIILIYMIMFKNPQIAEKLIETIPYQYRDWIISKTEIFRLRVTDWISEFRTPPDEH